MTSSKVKAVNDVIEGQSRQWRHPRSGPSMTSSKVKAVKRDGPAMHESNSVITLSPSPLATPSVRGLSQQLRTVPAQRHYENIHRSLRGLTKRCMQRTCFAWNARSSATRHFLTSGMRRLRKKKHLLTYLLTYLNRCIVLITVLPPNRKISYGLRERGHCSYKLTAHI